MSDSPHEALRADPDIGPLVETHGELTLDSASDLFERLVVSILRQQVSMASAAATRERLFDTVTVTPGGIKNADDEVLRDAGLSRQKTRYVNEVADAFLEHDYSLATFEDATDEEIHEELTAITGVGDWTANMQLLFAFGREDVFPVGDLGIRKGFEAVVGEGYSRTEMREYAERWSPYRSYASLYLWRASEDIAESVAEVSED
ncbi:DNA-3-methyladenine glycosylase 2 family protein [Haloarcula sp. CBA1130]|uniref:DNA-3-methyladenine glycosylase family protein n=1 Tax=unclassified Haloarcula TaxID=2624677 RepID=UPI001246FCCE|nr:MULTISPECIES: DNA-3-methyladenine glycosylase [unclassified Haloarcula]KAA9397882.1 DNA-3-methyladenine glycosylase 2 family protein [Haloarcula sp. CBA1129]KAA9402429.1 DNA-3-methyladenine glycosylase 2 family protein [Haloarcula sp. CBA1130]